VGGSCQAPALVPAMALRDDNRELGAAGEHRRQQALDRPAAPPVTPAPPRKSRSSRPRTGMCKGGTASSYFNTTPPRFRRPSCCGTSVVVPPTTTTAAPQGRWLRSWGSSQGQYRSSAGGKGGGCRSATTAISGGGPTCPGSKYIRLLYYFTLALDVVDRLFDAAAGDWLGGWSSCLRICEEFDRAKKTWSVVCTRWDLNPGLVI
jgi:hypothetical protein